LKIVSTIVCPIPGHENTRSVTIAPPSGSPQGRGAMVDLRHHLGVHPATSTLVSGLPDPAWLKGNRIGTELLGLISRDFVSIFFQCQAIAFAMCRRIDK
jgi:hypothetical protein